MGKRIVILGSNFAGFIAAIELRDRLGDEHEVVVVAPEEDFLFMPSLIWVPFGLRKRAEITFPLAPIYKSKKVIFLQGAATAIDLDRRIVRHTAVDAPLAYDYLLIATGPRLDWSAVPGLGPRGHTQSIMRWDDAEAARLAFERFVTEPGPVVIGAVQGASWFGAAYEFVLNMAHQLRERGLSGRAPVTYLTPEPFVGHFGTGGFGNAAARVEEQFRQLGIQAVTGASVAEIGPRAIRLHDGRALPFAYAMLIPPFTGAEVIRACADITDPAGFVRVDPFYRTTRPEVFAAGMAVSVDEPGKAWGVPKSGYLTEEMAKVVAHNIAATIVGDRLLQLPPQAIDAKYVLDAGNTGTMMFAEKALDPREHAWLLPGPEAHWAKIAFEKYFLSTHRRGRV